MIIFDEVAHDVVGEPGLDRLHHLVVEVVRESRCSRQEPQILHVVLVAVVNDRVVLIVSIHDLIVRLILEGLEEKCDEALASSRVSWALGVAMEAKPRTAEATLA